MGKKGSSVVYPLAQLGMLTKIYENTLNNKFYNLQTLPETFETTITAR